MTTIAPSREERLCAEIVTEGDARYALDLVSRICKEVGPGVPGSRRSGSARRSSGANWNGTWASKTLSSRNSRSHPLPVSARFLVAEVGAVVSSVITASRLAPTWILQVVLVVLFGILTQVRPMRNRLAFLHFAYWFGAIFDGATIVPLLVPSVAAAMLGIDAFQPGPDYRYATSVGAALMAGWTTLLVWGALRPVERRDILLLTVLPVMVGLVAAGAYAVSTGFVSLPHMAPTFVVQAVGIAIFLTAYAIAPSCASSQSSQSRHVPGQ